jgi:hypothetical protein
MKQYIVFAFLLTSLLLNPLQLRQKQQVPPPPPPESAPSATTKIYLPITMTIGNSQSQIPSVFGAEDFTLTPTFADRASAANVYWIRHATFNWAAIESVRGVYDWNQVHNDGIKNFSEKNFQLIANIKFTPSWAQKIPGVKCGPIAASAWTDFYNFIYATVARYSAPPYNIQYWEFGNEIDIDPSLVESDSVYGCWGDKNDRVYYGGEYYAEMLKHAYPAVKAASPTSKVMVGGLLLDCDPEHPAPGADCTAAKFFEGILHNQGANYFDVVNFHSYLYYSAGKILDENTPNWGARGGQLIGKINFLRSVMAKYGVNKPLFISEVAFKWGCTDCAPPPSAFYQLQADVVVNTYVRTWAQGLLGESWYTMGDSGWAYSGLYTGASPNPGFQALSFMTNELYGAAYSRQITSYPGLRAYEFLTQSKKIWVLWSPDGSTGVTIARPAGVTRMVDKYGSATTTIPASITVVHPIYLEFPK